MAIKCTVQYNAPMSRPKKNAGKHKQKTVSFRLPDDLMAQLRGLAKQNRRTLSGEVQLALENHLHSNGFAEPAKKETPSESA